MSDLTRERLARLRVWATREHPDRPGRRHCYYAFCPWCSDVGDPDQPDDDGNAHDLAIELLDEIERLRTELDDLGGQPAARRKRSDDDRFAAHAAPEAIRWYLRQAEEQRRRWDRRVLWLGALLEERQRQKDAGEWPTPSATTTVTSGDMAIELPGVEPNKVVDLMAALEASVAAAKEARTRHRPGGTRLDDIASEADITKLAGEET